MARVLIALLVFWTVCAVVHSAILRREDHNNERYKQDEEICIENQPCGWAIYNKTSRLIDNYTKNKCVCGPAKKCLRDKDDISITAYVYRCKPETQS